jgi:aminopeptidase N
MNLLTSKRARQNTAAGRARRSGGDTLRRALFPALLCVLVLPALALAERRERLIEGWRPVHYDVSLVFDDALSRLTRAETKITVRVLRDGLGVVDLDFGELAVDGVKVGGAAARYERSGGRLNVSLPRPARRGAQLIVSIAYHGTPKDGLVLTKDKDGNASATGDNWPDRVHHWIPSLDHPSAKATVNFTVTAPENYRVIATGRIGEVRAGAPGAKVWSFRERHPIPPYCMIVAVGKFSLSEPSSPPPARKLPPVFYLVPPSQSAIAEKSFGAALPSLALFDELVAPFPYDNLAHVVGATRFGGMENATAIVYAANVLDPRPEQPVSARFGVQRRLVELVAHETAHQWFGDAVTPATWADVWLSEGFATYFAGLLVERYEGEAAFREYMGRKGGEYLKYEKTRRAPIHDRDTEDLNGLLNPNSYQKGAWVLHTLRRQLGDAAFFRGVRAYYRAHLHATATTEDLRRALERASGRNLREFFARWVYAAGHPAYKVSWRWRGRGAAGGGTLVLTLAQTQADAPFLTPVPVEIADARGVVVRRLTVRPTGRETVTLVPLGSQPAEIRVDPRDTILKEVEAQAVRRKAA